MQMDNIRFNLFYLFNKFFGGIARPKSMEVEKPGFYTMRYHVHVGANFYKFRFAGAFVSSIGNITFPTIFNAICPISSAIRPVEPELTTTFICKSVFKSEFRVFIID
jgi:hypothetical protein